VGPPGLEPGTKGYLEQPSNAEEDATLGFEWAISQLREMMTADAFLDKKIISQLPLHPIRATKLAEK